MKYFINQLCTFHHFINEKYQYSFKSWNDPIIFYEQDLFITLKYLKVATCDELKKIIPSIICDITYGGKMLDQSDIASVRMYI